MGGQWHRTSRGIHKFCTERGMRTMNSVQGVLYIRESHQQLGDLNATVGREDIFKPTIRNESLHEISNDMIMELE
jgi:hypothetical protein